MSAYKGTPGPWAIQMAEDCRGRQLDEMVKWVVTAYENDMWVSTGPTWDPEHDAEALANAHLIASAPNLLQANVLFVESIDFLYNITPAWNDDRIYDDLPSSGLAIAYLAARAAIRKATGEQP